MIAELSLKKNLMQRKNKSSVFDFKISNKQKEGKSLIFLLLLLFCKPYFTSFRKIALRVERSSEKPRSAALRYIS